MTGPPPGGVDPGRDERALRALSVGYASAVDRRDGAGFAHLFEPDGTLMVPDLARDLRPVVERTGHEVLRGVPGGLDRYLRTFHQVGNCEYRVDGDHARGAVQCVAHHLSAGQDGAGTALDTVWFIRYDDRYRLGTGGWRIARRELHLLWTEEHQVALVGPPPSP